MPVKLLDPTLDIVFKLLLLRNQDLLRDMIEAVLNPQTPIESVEILNPEIQKNHTADKGIALDLRLRLQNGHQIDLEMQSTVPDGIHARFLYYWAKTFAGTLTAGDDYTTLRPTISILWLKKPLLKVPGFHSVFHIAEDHTREIFCREFELHVLELENLGLATADRRAKLERWARFLKAKTPEELETLANEDATMNTARNALERLSFDPEARRLAEERETAQLMHQHLMGSAFEAGEAKGESVGFEKGESVGFEKGESVGFEKGESVGFEKGESVGFEKGESVGLAKERKETIRTLCQVFDIPIDEARAKRVDELEASPLAELINKLKTARQWPRDE